MSAIERVVKRRKHWLHCSASQVNNYRLCKRRWYASSILGLPDPEMPSAALGKRLHSRGEQYLLGEQVRTLKNPNEQMMLETLISQLPKPNPRFMVEREISMPTFEGGPRFVGFIDLLDPDRVNKQGLDEPLVHDHKTKADLRTAKKPQELLQDVQMVGYGKWAFRCAPHLETVLLKHLYLQVKGKGRGKKKIYPTMTAQVVADRAGIDAEWDKILVDISDMQAWADSGHETVKKLPPNVSSCHAFGRDCPYLSECGYAVDPEKLSKFGEPKRLPVINATATVVSKEEPMATLQERIAAKKAAAGGATAAAAAAAAKKPAATPAPAAKPAVGGLAARRAALNPPDAPANAKNAGKAPKVVDAEEPEADDMGQLELPDEEVTEETPPPKKGGLAARRAASAMTAQLDEEEQVEPEYTGDPAEHEAELEAQEEEEPAPAPARKPAAAPPRPAPRAVTAPAKKKPPVEEPEPDEGLGTSPSFTLYIRTMPYKGEKYTLLSDLFKPVGQQIAEDFKVADYRLVDFGKWRGPAAAYLKQMIEEHHDGKSIVVQGVGPTADLAVDVLSGLATKIVGPCS